MQQIPNNQEYQGARISVTMPAVGVAAVVASRPGGQFVFDFDLSNATFVRSENSLVIQADNGASVTLSDYFAVGDESLPDLVLADGSVVAGKDFLAQFSDIDLSTAAGPGGGDTAIGSGAGEYADAAGDLIDGVDRLESLGAAQWAQGGEPAITDNGAVPLAAAPESGLSVPPGPTPGPTPPGPTPPGPTPPGPGPEPHVDDHVVEAVNDSFDGSITTTTTQTKIVVDMSAHAAISVRGSVMHSGSVTDKDASRTAMEYAGSMQINSQHNDSAQNRDLARGDFYKKFFKDETGKGLSKSEVLDPANTIVLEFKNGVIDVDAVNKAAAEALAQDKILVITGAANFSLPNGSHTLGVEGVIMVLEGGFSSSSRVTVNGFVLLEGSYTNGAHTSVEGGLAVFGNYSNSGNSTASGAEDPFTVITDEIVTKSVDTFTVAAADLLANDKDSAGHALHLNPESLTLQDGMDKYFDLHYDQGTGAITVTPKDSALSGMPEDWNGRLSFTYTVSDDEGNTSNAATVDIDYGTGHANALHADILFGGESAADSALILGSEHDTILFAGSGNETPAGGAGENVPGFTQGGGFGGDETANPEPGTGLGAIQDLGGLAGEADFKAPLLDMLDTGDAWGNKAGIDAILADSTGREAPAPANGMGEGPERMIADPAQGGNPEAEAELMLRMLTNTM